MVLTDCFYSTITFLTIKEISRVEILSKFHKRVSNDEKIREKIVFRDFGIDVLCGSTWQDTSINLTKEKMFNLNDIWANKMTYKDIIGRMKNIDNKLEYLCKLQKDSYPYEDLTEWLDSPVIYNSFNMTEMEILVRRHITSEEKNILRNVLTVEFFMLYHCVDISLKNSEDLLTNIRKLYNMYQ
uniref:Uncharacterized protein n=1 Tax=Pithovirus LCPAC403 TaxID=2506596 RepID=A0A481ZCM9_9VIRU|nr:MAG: uncharacterized protein LCPAC403_02260 [Pithovirus LCPAC403]